MSKTVIWDPEKVQWQYVPSPYIYRDGKYYMTSAYQFSPKLKRYIRLWGKTIQPKIVNFNTCTLDELRDSLQAHYTGLMDVERIWEIGDMRRDLFLDIPSIKEEKVPMYITNFNSSNLPTKNAFKDKYALTLQSYPNSNLKALSPTEYIEINSIKGKLDTVQPSFNYSMTNNVYIQILAKENNNTTQTETLTLKNPNPFNINIIVTVNITGRISYEFDSFLVSAPNTTKAEKINSKSYKFYYTLKSESVLVSPISIRVGHYNLATWSGVYSGNVCFSLGGATTTDYQYMLNM